VALTIVFLGVVATLLPFSVFSVQASGAGQPVGLVVLVALLVCLIPTTIGGLLSAIGVAGMSRMMQANVIATSGRAVEAAGDVDVLLLDKTGTITLGNRQATAFVPAPGVSEQSWPTPPSWPRWPTKRPRPQHRGAGQAALPAARARSGRPAGQFVPFTAQTRMSGVDLPSPAAAAQLRKGAADAVRRHVEALGGAGPPRCRPAWRTSPAAAARRWWWPMAAGPWAWSSSRTSSRAASASALPSCAAWASRR
jgi:K+-transporting ATPase ATPase B chain